MYLSHSADAAEQKRILLQIYNALLESGYDPIRQITGYLISEDPTYIPDYRNARALIAMVDRELLLSTLIRDYLIEK